ncbi:MAG: glycosyltransferase family 4 protein [Burkholderiales bacterium]|nr:glycosyltransferase family 4 protein [Burkholderiales bacterium]
MRSLDFVLPGDPATLTGGYEYGRRAVAGLRDLGWDVRVHSLDASFPAPTAAALAHARRTLAGIPSGGLVLVDGLALGAMPDVAAAEASRLALCALVHHPLAEETGLAAGEAARLRASETRALAAVRKVIATSAATARALAAYGVSAPRIAVVQPGTDPAPLARGSGGPGLALVCVASLTPRKGHERLLAALGALADRAWHLTCAGSLERAPATAARVRRAIAELGLGHRVTLAGELDRQRIDALYDRADAFVLATFHEGYGMALAEALARGLPVVSTRAGAVPDTVPGDAGLLVPPGDAAALRDALARLLDEPELRDRLAAGARRARERLPTWPDACARLAAALVTAA